MLNIFDRSQGWVSDSFKLLRLAVNPLMFYKEKFQLKHEKIVFDNHKQSLNSTKNGTFRGK